MATTESIEKAIDDMRGGESVGDPNAEEQRRALARYTQLTYHRTVPNKVSSILLLVVMVLFVA